MPAFEAVDLLMDLVGIDGPNDELPEIALLDDCPADLV